MVPCGIERIERWHDRDDPIRQVFDADNETAAKRKDLPYLGLGYRVSVTVHILTCCAQLRSNRSPR
jgi:hypothetical protein